ncbi:MAG: hypothetical protein Q8P41_27170 [Pseudomonadota bacterium]|nr:hypothetical protein [Pseudomonadota bacterium]
MTLLWLLLACRTATVVNACDLDPSLCLACSTDDECVYTGNACTETVYCAHEDAPIAVVQIGCDRVAEYAWPAPETCRCVAGACSADQ